MKRVSLFCLLLFLAGCGGDATTKPSPKQASPEKPTGPTKLEIPESLPEPGEPVTSISGPPKMEVPTPADWIRQSRREGLLIWWIAEEGSAYPRLYLRAKRSEEPDFTAENIEQNWDAFSKREDEEFQIVPLKPRPWLLNQKKTKSSKGFPLSKETYLTVANGWEYSLELLTAPGETAPHRPAVLGLAKALAFPAEGEDEETQPD